MRRTFSATKTYARNSKRDGGHSTTSPSYANSTLAGNRLESRACKTSWLRCVRNARRGLILSMYSSASFRPRCVECGFIRTQSRTSTSRSCRPSIVPSEIKFRSVAYAKSLKRYAITGSFPWMTSSGVTCRSAPMQNGAPGETVCGISWGRPPPK